MRRRWMVLTAAIGLLTGWSNAAPRDPFNVRAAVKAEGTGWVATLAFAVPPRHHLYADDIRVQETGGLALSPVAVAKPTRIRDTFTETDRDVYTNDFVLSYRVGTQILTGLTLRVEYQGCDESTCFFPQTRLFPLAPGTDATLVVPPNAQPSAPAGIVDWPAFDAALRPTHHAAGYVRPSDFLAFLGKATGAHTSVPRGPSSVWAGIREAVALFSASPIDFLRRFGAAWTVLLILLGGFLLNLTPCVLPMIPVNLAILGAGAKGGSRARGFGLGAAYGAGIAVVYGGLGLIVVLSGSQFGVLNSMPWFNAVIAVMFAFLGLAMFDVIQIDLTRFQTGAGGAPSRSGTYAAAAGMGGLSALLAGACVAPVVLAVLLLSSNLYAAGAAVGLVLPFVLGLGMALPWPLAGAGLAYIPRPGAWMSWVKYGFGVFIMILAIYYASVAIRGWRGPPTAGRTDAGVVNISAEEGPVGWGSVLAQARASGKPVFVDFWASWCKNCEAMEATTFRDAQVRKALSAFIVVKCRAERPNDAATRATLEHFGVMGLPTYVILTPVSAETEARSP